MPYPEVEYDYVPNDPVIKRMIEAQQQKPKQQYQPPAIDPNVRIPGMEKVMDAQQRGSPMSPMGLPPGFDPNNMANVPMPGMEKIIAAQQKPAQGDAFNPAMALNAMKTGDLPQLPKELHEMLIGGPNSSYTASYGGNGLQFMTPSGGERIPLGANPTAEIMNRLNEEANQKSLQKGLQETGLQGVHGLGTYLQNRYQMADNGQMMPQYMRDQAIADQQGYARLQAGLQDTQIKENAARDLAMAQMNQNAQQKQLDRESSERIADRNFNKTFENQMEGAEYASILNGIAKGDATVARKIWNERKAAMPNNPVQPNQANNPSATTGQLSSTPEMDAAKMMDLLITTKEGGIQIPNSGDALDPFVNRLMSASPESIAALSNRIRTMSGDTTPLLDALSKKLAFLTSASNPNYPGGSIDYSIGGQPTGFIFNNNRDYRTNPTIGAAPFRTMVTPDGRTIPIKQSDLPSIGDNQWRTPANQNLYKERAGTLLNLLSQAIPKKKS